MRYQVLVGETGDTMHYAGTRDSEEAAQQLAREIVAARPPAVQPHVRTEVRVHPDDVSPRVMVAGQTVAFAVAVQQMEDELREELHDRQEWESEQAFIDAYSAAHEARFGTPFRVS